VAVTRAPSRPRHLIVSAAPIMDDAGQVIGRVVALHDISPLRQWERARNEFLAMSAHELRSPVTGITLAAQLLQRRTAQLPDDLRAQHAEPTLAILRQARRLQHLVNDLLDSARLEGGLLTMQPEPFDLGALARRLADEAISLGVARVVVEAPSAAVVAIADPARVEQIIANLLDNARKYGPPDRPVVLTVVADGGAARVAVRDEGPGIPADDLPRLFERFFRASNVADTTTGLGLGLALSRELARRMGGDLVVETAEGRGSTFTLTLPLSEGGGGEAGKQGRAGEGAG
jgi:two-component system phosphate regulon sensor histidine kinase PhoR